MGKEQKNQKKEENNEVKNNEEENKAGKKKNVVLKAFMHCEGCSDKISKCLRDFDGVENVAFDRDNHKVVLSGSTIDPMKALERLQKKYNKNVELIAPKPKPENEQKKAPEKEEQAQVKTNVLNMRIHCEGCANDIKKCIRKMEGVFSVEVNMDKSLVVVRGTVEATKLVESVKKRLGKHAEIVKQEDNKSNRKEKETQKAKEEIIMFSYPSQYSTQYMYPNQTFSDENVFSCSIM